MGEHEAATREWLLERFDVSRETLDRLSAYVALLVAEAGQHNLVAASTLPGVWDRHIRDSAQLLPLAEGTPASWIDFGSGAGLPGLVLAILGARHVTLVESRRLRIGFLEKASGLLGLGECVRIAGMAVERLEAARYDVITARAFTSLERIFAFGARFSDVSTQWILPKGKTAAQELATARKAWQGEFEIVASETDPDAGIVLARNVKPGRAR
ncbi:MAG: 16S rRNA (guanine(527)-N(7))-methyltransferase RsmG [Sphingomonadaceae bacterium]|nr:16S rRNA (guanine(527)-N(7))-methyltransferase RsmG [Sphingomonadaceae bacterium]